MVQLNNSEYVKYTEPLKNYLEGILPCLSCMSVWKSDRKTGSEEEVTHLR